MSRFDYVEYDKEAIETQKLFKKMFIDLESTVNLHIKCGRSKALVMTNLEETYMWVGKGVRNDQIEKNGSAPLQEGRTDS